MFQLRSDRRKEEESIKEKSDQVLQLHIQKIHQKAEDIARNNDELDTTDYMMTEDSFMIPVIFHDLKGYASNLNLQYITRMYAPISIDVIPTFSQKYLSFQIGNLRFLDSLQFLTASLDTLVQSFAADGKDKFSHIARD